MITVEYAEYRDQHYGPWATVEEAEMWARGGLDDDPAVASWKVATVASLNVQPGQALDIRFPL